MKPEEFVEKNLKVVEGENETKNLSYNGKTLKLITGELVLDNGGLFSVNKKDDFTSYIIGFLLKEV